MQPNRTPNSSVLFNSFVCCPSCKKCKCNRSIIRQNSTRESRLNNTTLTGGFSHLPKIAKLAVNFASKPPHIVLEQNVLAILKSCNTASQLKQIHSHIITHGLDPASQYVVPTFLSRCFGYNHMCYAHKVFDQIRNRNASLYDAMFRGYLQKGMFREVLSLFKNMRGENIMPSCYSLSLVIKPCVKLKALKECEEVHCLVLKFGFESNTYVASALINVYSSAKEVRCAYKVFDGMVAKDVVMCTSMINGFLTNGELDSARRLFELAPARDVVLCNTMVTGYIENGDMKEAQKLFNVMPDKDLISWNTLLNGYANNGDVKGCEKHFDRMPERNIFSWNGLIAGYACNECFNEVLDAFERMLNESDVQPNYVTLVHVLFACSKLCAIDLGRWVHGYAESIGCMDNVFICNGLIELYAKCGMIESAMNVFRDMGRKDLISWNTIINGLAAHGHGADALKLYSEMKLAGEKPDGITFVGILSACAHLGLVDEGFSYFQSMIDEHAIKPQMEHFGCIVDLLGRAGLLQQAVDFVNKMPINADAVIWTTLLGACRVHKNVKVAELALHNLIQIEPNNLTHHVMLGNIYKDAKRWQDVAQFRDAETFTKSKKLPGCSSII